MVWSSIPQLCLGKMPIKRLETLRILRQKRVRERDRMRMERVVLMRRSRRRSRSSWRKRSTKGIAMGVRDRMLVSKKWQRRILSVRICIEFNNKRFWS